MSQVQMGGVDLCDNLPSPEALTVQTQNLNETSTLPQTQSLSLLQKEDGGGQGLTQKASLSNDGKDGEEEKEKEGFTRGDREEDEEEDIDEVMKEEEEEEVSEGSSSLIRCQSPDTPMTDSSYSETGMEHTDIHTYRYSHYIQTWTYIFTHQYCFKSSPFTFLMGEQFSGHLIKILKVCSCPVTPEKNMLMCLCVSGALLSGRSHSDRQLN